MTALGDPTRQAIFERLVERPRPVGELAGELPVTRPAGSQHLKVLKDAGLVIDRKVGTRRVYQVDPQAVADLRAYFDAFWDQSLAAFRDAAETEEKRDVAPAGAVGRRRPAQHRRRGAAGPGVHRLHAADAVVVADGVPPDRRRAANRTRPPAASPRA